MLPEMVIFTSSFLPLTSLVFHVHVGQKRIGASSDLGGRFFSKSACAKFLGRATIDTIMDAIMDVVGDEYLGLLNHGSEIRGKVWARHRGFTLKFDVLGRP